MNQCSKISSCVDFVFCSLLTAQVAGKPGPPGVPAARGEACSEQENVML